MNELDDLFAGAAAHPERFGVADPDPSTAARLDANLRVVHAELDALPESRLARVLRRLGVPDLTVPLVAATPALRRSWFIAIAIAVLFAVSVAANDGQSGVDRIAFFLTMAPLVPLLGVALAFGRGVDPTHDIVVAAPRDTFRVFLIRAVTVLVASAIVLLLSSLLLPVGGWYRFAWLLPALALTMATMAISAGRDARIVAAGVAAAWVVVVVIVNGAASSADMFGVATQISSIGVAVVGAWMLVRRRRAVEVTGVRA